MLSNRPNFKVENFRRCQNRRYRQLRLKLIPSKLWRYFRTLLDNFLQRINTLCWIESGIGSQFFRKYLFVTTKIFCSWPREITSIGSTPANGRWYGNS